MASPISTQRERHLEMGKEEEEEEKKWSSRISGLDRRPSMRRQVQTLDSSLRSVIPNFPDAKVNMAAKCTARIDDDVLGPSGAFVLFPPPPPSRPSLG